MTEIDRPGVSPFDAIRRTDDAGEHWKGRELQPLMDYSQWRDFAIVIEKAKASLALVQGQSAAQANFAEVRKNAGQAGRNGKDYRLTRFAAYLVAMAGDDTKEAVAQARIYFAVKTREAELAEVARAAAPPAVEPFTPTTYPLADVVVLIRQRFGVRISVGDLTEKLRQGGVLRQDGKPKVKYESLFWHTGETGRTYEVFGHQIEAVYRLYESTKLRLELAAQRALPLDPPGWPELPLGEAS